MNHSTPTSLSITSYRSSLRLMCIESVMLCSHLILCRPLLLLPPIPLIIRVFSNESTLHMRWPKYWSFSFSISPSNEHQGLVSLRWTGWISLQSKGLSSIFSNTTEKSINSLALSLLYDSTITSVHNYWKKHPWTVVSKNFIYWNKQKAEFWKWVIDCQTMVNFLL